MNFDTLQLVTAIITPYNNDTTIDLNAYDVLIERQINNGVDGIVVGGTTGGGHIMHWSEHLMLIAHSVHKYGRDISIIGNTGSNYTKEAVEATKYGFSVGMDAALQINPYYGLTSNEGVLRHFNQVLNIGPSIIYNVPGRTNQDISVDTIVNLSKHHNFVGVKECSGKERINYYSSIGIRCWTGNDNEIPEVMVNDSAIGAISVLSNIFPKLVKTLILEHGHKEIDKLQCFTKWLFSSPNPIPVTSALAMLSLIKPVYRLPYVPCKNSDLDAGFNFLEYFYTEGVIDTMPKKLTANDFISK